MTIRLLTQKVKDSGPLRRVFAAAKGQRDFDIRIATGNNLHDRYVIDDQDMLILGTRLNGFGRKQCFVVKTGADMRQAILAVFDGKWIPGQPWPP